LQEAGREAASFKLLVTHFWHRLIGTSLSWYCNDFLFYGNATFRNSFIRYGRAMIPRQHLRVH